MNKIQNVGSTISIIRKYCLFSTISNKKIPQYLSIFSLFTKIYNMQSPLCHMHTSHMHVNIWDTRINDNFYKMAFFSEQFPQKNPEIAIHPKKNRTKFDACVLVWHPVLITRICPAHNYRLPASGSPPPALWMFLQLWSVSSLFTPSSLFARERLEHPPPGR